ncbi:MAG: polysaccharide biosynthesis C-terminal domain-containing protein [bacterium]
MINLKGSIKNIILSGMINIFVAEIFNKIVVFISSIFVIRVLTTSEYGMLSIENNIFSISILFTGFGITSGVLQFCSEKRERTEKLSILSYGILIGLLSSIILSVLIYIYGCNYSSVIAARKYIKQAALLPLFYYLFIIGTIYLRSQREIKKYTALLIINTIIYAALSIVGAKLFGVSGVIYSRYLGYIVAALLGFIYLKDDIYEGFSYLKGLSYKVKKELWKYSIMCGVVGAINQMAYLIDVAMISEMIKDAKMVGIYKVSTLIPENLNFIPNSVMIVIIPYYAYHLSDKKWISSTTKRLIKIMATINSSIVILLFILSPLIIKMIWGEKYELSVFAFRILLISYFFLGTFRLISTQILASQRYAHINLWISVASLIFNIIGNYILIKKLGINGAAISTLLVVVMTSLLQMPAIKNIIKNGERK